MRYQAYSEYKESGVEWLEEVPVHWEIKKLKFLAKVIPSNVDKKTKNGEVPVTLCNYTDVYYNDFVDSSIDFMKASATVEQVKKFTLQSGDTIITKDSEDPNDIAIPTFVPNKINGTICGYHLSIIRPNIVEFGAYIKRVFECGYARAYFSTRANGLTRYGLGTYPLNNIYYPKPSTEEAKQIANFLDHETAKIDTLIEKQQQLIKLLKEKRQAVISHAVTKGLNPDAPMKDSGVEWLGEVPEHWVVSSLGYYAKISTGATPDRSKKKYWDGDIPWIKTGEVKYDKIVVTEECISSKAVENSSVKISPIGTLLMAMYGQGVTRGRVAILGVQASYNQACAAIDSNREINNEFLRYFFMATYNAIRDGGNETSQMNLNADIVSKFKITIPKLDEQNEVIKYLDAKLKKYDVLIQKSEKSINLVKERRTALISAAVTGKIDVRNWIDPNKENRRVKSDVELSL